MRSVDAHRLVPRREVDDLEAPKREDRVRGGDDRHTLRVRTAVGQGADRSPQGRDVVRLDRLPKDPADKSAHQCLRVAVDMIRETRSATRSQVKRRSARSRLRSCMADTASDLARASTSLADRVAASCGGTTQPVSPCAMISGMAHRSLPTHGSPCNIASTNTTPNGSNSEGMQKTSAL